MSAPVQPRSPGLDHLQREERRRWAALAVVEDGDDPLAVAQRAGVPTSTVHAWARDYRAAGAGGLAPRAGNHTPPQLDAARTRHLVGMLVDTDPRDQGYSPALWSRDLVRALVADRFRVALSTPATTRLLRRLGIALRRPQEDLHPVGGVPRGADAEMAAEGLVYIGATTAPRRQAASWRPAEASDPAPVSVLSAAAARGCVRFSASSGPLVAETVVRFLGRLRADATGPLVVVVGAGAVYDSPEVGAYLESTRGRVRLHRGRPLQEGGR